MIATLYLPLAMAIAAKMAKMVIMATLAMAIMYSNVAILGIQLKN